MPVPLLLVSRCQTRFHEDMSDPSNDRHEDRQEGWHTDWQEAARKAFASALDAGHPARITADAVAELTRPPTAIMAIGKAAAAMASAAIDAGGMNANDLRGIIVTNDENFTHIAGMDCYASAHPVPDERGIVAAQAVGAMAQSLGKDDHLLALISGGGSALLPAPATGITLAQKAVLNEALLASGMDIHQMNAVRRLFSTLKGGRLARLAHPAKITQLLLSDVPEDRLESIASGPFAADPVPLQTAFDLITQNRLDRLDFVAQHMVAIKAGTVDQPVRPNEPEINRVSSHILASNSLCQRVATQSMAAAVPSFMTATNQALMPLTGDAVDCGVELARLVTAKTRQGNMFGIAGGETTVVLGDGDVGKGGRSQELALAFACEMAETDEPPRRWLVLAGGTDGRDGPTDAAGAIIQSGGPFDLLAAKAALAAHDAYHYLEARDQLLKVAPTGTNLGDLVIVIAA